MKYKKYRGLFVPNIGVPKEEFNYKKITCDALLGGGGGGVDTQAKGSKASGLDRADRVNSLTKLTEVAWVDHLT